MRDQGYPALSSSILVVINVSRNANEPVFARTNYDLSLDENISSGTSVETVVATDADNVSVLEDSLHFYLYWNPFN